MLCCDWAFVLGLSGGVPTCGVQVWELRENKESLHVHINFEKSLARQEARYTEIC